MLSIIHKIHNFFYAVIHATQLMEEKNEKEKQIQHLREELAKANQDARTLQREVEDAGKRINYLHEIQNHLCDQNKALNDAIPVICGFIKGGQFSGEQAAQIYDAVSGTLDADGYKLFAAAQDILGPFSSSLFAYEDNLGYFEEASGFTMLSYLLVQYDYLLGDTNANRIRWEFASSCYEKCIDLTIDKSTPEYKDFENKLYIKVLDNLGLFSPEKVQSSSDSVGNACYASAS